MFLCGNIRPLPETGSISCKRFDALRVELQIQGLGLLRWPRFIYGTLDSKSPLSITSCEGATITSDEVQWAAAAKDDGWLAPYGKEWQEPGRILFMRPFDGPFGRLLPDISWILRGIYGIWGIERAVSTASC